MRRTGLHLCWVLSLLLCLWSAPTFAAGYSYVRTVTIDHTKVPTTDRSNFPVLFSGTYSYLKTTANGGNVTNASGYDIIFTSDAAGATKLDHEIETYTATTGAVNFWVRVPTVSHTTDTVIYLWYGNAAITASQENVTGVWDSNFKGVWHLPNGTTLTANDSTGVNNGTNNGATAITGEIDGGAHFVAASSQWIDFGNNASLTGTGALTASAWVQFSGTGDYTVLARVASGPDSGVWDIETFSGNIYFSISSTGSLWTKQINTSGTYNNNSWHLIHAIYDPSTAVRIYVDGVSVVSDTISIPAALYSNTSTLKAGKSGGFISNFFDGNLDEIRVSNVARSADWITTEYNNQNSPSTFYTVGAEQYLANYFRRRLQ